MGGAKVGDDTLSTLSNSLLRYILSTGSQPVLYRTGYDENGKIIDLT